MESVASSFLERFDAARVAEEVKPLWDYSRVGGGLEGDKVVGTTRSWASDLTVPGGARLPAAAVAGVTVRATHRPHATLHRPPLTYGPLIPIILVRIEQFPRSPAPVGPSQENR